MEKRHKDPLQPLVAELRRTLAGSADGSVRGDLGREPARIERGVGRQAQVS
jgi:hypothetical protein